MGGGYLPKLLLQYLLMRTDTALPSDLEKGPLLASEPGPDHSWRVTLDEKVIASKQTLGWKYGGYTYQVNESLARIKALA